VIVQALDDKRDLSGIVVVENWSREFARPGR
jgi:hypothetical protein